MDWLTIIVTAATVLGVAGAVLNIYKHYLCPILWEFANVLLIIYNLQRAEYQQAFLFFVYLLVTGAAVVKWWRDDSKNTPLA